MKSRHFFAAVLSASLFLITGQADSGSLAENLLQKRATSNFFGAPNEAFKISEENRSLEGLANEISVTKGISLIPERHFVRIENATIPEILKNIFDMSEARFDFCDELVGTRGTRDECRDQLRRVLTPINYAAAPHIVYLSIRGEERRGDEKAAFKIATILVRTDTSPNLVRVDLRIFDDRNRVSVAEDEQFAEQSLELALSTEE